MRWLALLIAVAACSRSSPTATATTTATTTATATATTTTTTTATATTTTTTTTTATPTTTTTPCTTSLASRTADARSLLDAGADLHTAVVDGTFLYVDPEHTPLFAKSLDLARQVLAALRHGRIAAHPLCPVSVYVFSSVESFNRFCGSRGYTTDGGDNAGVYDPVGSVIVANLSGGERYVPTTAHELAHVLMDADFDAPAWFRECVASQYESPVFSGDDIHGTDDWRYKQLRPAVARRDPTAHLGTLFGMSDDDFRAKLDGGAASGWTARASSGRSTRDGATVSRRIRTASPPSRA
jgi:hypothetical protein